MGGVAGIAAVAGVGFTVSLFVTGLAFDDPALRTRSATLSVLAASVVAAFLGAASSAGSDRARHDAPRTGAAHGPRI